MKINGSADSRKKYKISVPLSSQSRLVRWLNRDKGTVNDQFVMRPDRYSLLQIVTHEVRIVNSQAQRSRSVIALAGQFQL